ncbi:hypothetical protein LSH36_194g00011 [Paralvinella palmiformis]|uniref:Uncharacterized protein n=1 Tax=Paralvinella palmiformis TaxID=53620 RepID=A0AAD9N7T0_9ANNE|nr:hypothetical protein LSH36_194g00011 [Paralvinella palmiformis]
MKEDIFVGYLQVAIFASLTALSSGAGFSSRGCSGQEAQLNCPSEYYIKIISAVAGFGSSGASCTGTAKCLTDYLDESLNEVNGSLREYAIRRCNDQHTCQILVQDYWQLESIYCDNNVYNITYLDLTYYCSGRPRVSSKEWGQQLKKHDCRHEFYSWEQTTSENQMNGALWVLEKAWKMYTKVLQKKEFESTLRSCPGQEARFYCRSGYRIESISIVGGFHPTPISCRGTAYCKTSYVRGALVEYDGNISAFAIDECKHKQTCHISIVQSWQSSPSYCYNNAYDISYVEVEYTCSPMPRYNVKSCSGEAARLRCRPGLYVDVTYAVGGFAPSGTTCTNTARCTTPFVRATLGELSGDLRTLAVNKCKHKQTCDVMVENSWKSVPAYCNNNEYNINYLKLEYVCSPLPITMFQYVFSSLTRV